MVFCISLAGYCTMKPLAQITTARMMIRVMVDVAAIWRRHVKPRCIDTARKITTGSDYRTCWCRDLSAAWCNTMVISMLSEVYLEMTRPFKTWNVTARWTRTGQCCRHCQGKAVTWARLLQLRLEGNFWSTQLLIGTDGRMLVVVLVRIL